ncbi:putative major facilitator superfamily domain-containing protein [Lupinus albus]|uniref:Putative major facilitator superfamily domain-containing protein n=1 Tax=Lupinus albus TaxID=3870 RepID=A0A6A4QXM8_LUPAL|nr:putative major facilitator superfamily domain-containing protein [Lupinus albus]
MRHLTQAIYIAISIILIGFGYSMGDDLNKKTRPHVMGFFVFGFWILDMTNNMLQGPCRAFFGDLSGGDQPKNRTRNSTFSFFMAIASILGYVVGSYSKLYKAFPFTETKACNVYCSNLKSCFFIAIALLLILVIIACVYVKEIPLTSTYIIDSEDGVKTPCWGLFFGAFKEMKHPMWMLFLVTILNWFTWFPWVLYDTYWMGREVYGGSVGDHMFDKGVHDGSIGLMLNSIVVAVMSMVIEPLSRFLGGVKKLWGLVNFILAICLAMTMLISKEATAHRHFLMSIDAKDNGPPPNVWGGAVTLLSVLGIPLAIISHISLPYFNNF